MPCAALHGSSTPRTIPKPAESHSSSAVATPRTAVRSGAAGVRALWRGRHAHSAIAATPTSASRHTAAGAARSNASAPAV